MLDRQQKQKIRWKMPLVVLCAVGCLGTGGVVIANGVSAHNNNQQVTQAEATQDLNTLPNRLVALLKDPEGYVRYRAARALGELGATQAIPQLLILLKDPEWSVRDSAATALGELGATQAIPQLLILLKDPEWSVRYSAATALGELGATQAIPQLLMLLKDPEGDVRDSAATALGELGATQAIPQLLMLLKDPEGDVRDSAATALGELGATQAIPQLLMLLKDPEGSVRSRAATALGELGATQAIPQLLILLKDPEWSVRASAIQALANIYKKVNPDPASNQVAVAQARQTFNQSLMFLGSSSLATLVLLLLMLQNLRQLQGITWSGYLNCYFPEEVVAELAALRVQLTQAQKSTWLIHYILFCEVFTLIRVFYVQIPIDNLGLPSRDRRIDD